MRKSAAFLTPLTTCLLRYSFTLLEENEGKKSWYDDEFVMKTRS